MKSPVLRFLRDTSGATAIEYGLIAAGIWVAIIAVVNALLRSRVATPGIFSLAQRLSHVRPIVGHRSL